MHLYFRVVKSLVEAESHLTEGLPRRLPDKLFSNLLSTQTPRLDSGSGSPTSEQTADLYPGETVLRVFSLVPAHFSVSVINSITQSHLGSTGFAWLTG